MVIKCTQFSLFFQTPLQVFGIEGRYATALYSAASKQQKLEAVEKETKALQVGYEVYHLFTITVPAYHGNQNKIHHSEYCHLFLLYRFCVNVLVELRQSLFTFKIAHLSSGCRIGNHHYSH